MKKIRWIAAAFTLTFIILMAIRLDLRTRFFPEADIATPVSPGPVPESDTWMNLYLKDKKIGYSHSVLTRENSGFRMDETLFMRMNIMGFSQDVRMTTSADLKDDLSLNSFDFSLRSGLFEFNASGKMLPGNKLSLTTDLSGNSGANEIQLAHVPHLTGAVLHAAARDYEQTKKDTFTFHIFDPATMSQQPVTVRVMGTEKITVMGQPADTTKLTLTFKGAVQTAWMADNGEILREKGLLGMTLEKTSKKEALAGLTDAAASEDITEIASIKSNVTISSPRDIVFLEAELSGVDPASLYIDGGRQTRSGKTVSIERENLEHMVAFHENFDAGEFSEFLRPEPFIESDHPTISKLAEKLTSAESAPLDKARRLVDWVFENIEKRPVLSIPDAVTTLENRIGDCNEHAVLLAALARAAGLPSKIESGLAYLNGRFYYHAWNLLYVGKWVTADAVFGLLPADAARIRFASGNPRSQLDLMPVIDRVGIQVIEVR